MEQIKALILLFVFLLSSSFLYAAGTSIKTITPSPASCGKFASGNSPRTYRVSPVFMKEDVVEYVLSEVEWQASQLYKKQLFMDRGPIYSKMVLHTTNNKAKPFYKVTNEFNNLSFENRDVFGSGGLLQSTSIPIYSTRSERFRQNHGRIKATPVFGTSKINPIIEATHARGLEVIKQELTFEYLEVFEKNKDKFTKGLFELYEILEHGSQRTNKSFEKQDHISLMRALPFPLNARYLQQFDPFSLELKEAMPGERRVNDVQVKLGELLEQNNVWGKEKDFEFVINNLSEHSKFVYNSELSNIMQLDIMVKFIEAQKPTRARGAIKILEQLDNFIQQKKDRSNESEEKFEYLAGLSKELLKSLAQRNQQMQEAAEAYKRKTLENIDGKVEKRFDVNVGSYSLKNLNLVNYLAGKKTLFDGTSSEIILFDAIYGKESEVMIDGQRTVKYVDLMSVEKRLKHQEELFSLTTHTFRAVELKTEKRGEEEKVLGVLAIDINKPNNPMVLFTTEFLANKVKDVDLFISEVRMQN